MHNLRFAVYMATRYTRLRERCFEFDDLVQEACLGLVEAATAYKAGETARFTTYAAYHIKNNIIVAAKWRTDRSACQTKSTMPSAGQI